jgi:hypothetical protein
MKTPDEVVSFLRRKFTARRGEWLAEGNADAWPLVIPLGIPTEKEALLQTGALRAWITQWKAWKGPGQVIWVERKWPSLGTQSLPEKISFQNELEIIETIGETENWLRAKERYDTFVALWPDLKDTCAHLYREFVLYSDANIKRIIKTLKWFIDNPDINIYPRQLPVPGLDSKWFEKHQWLIDNLHSAITGNEITTLRKPPQMVRFRLLHHTMMYQFHGLSDISAPFEELAKLALPVERVFIVENEQTFLSFTEMPGAIVFWGHGYSVNICAGIPWLRDVPCYYWGDIDTHGFAILNRARSHLPQLQSILMDSSTLLKHRDYWVNEPQQSTADELPLLTSAEREVYSGLKQQRWGQNVRLEQERIEWGYAWDAIEMKRL